MRNPEAKRPKDTHEADRPALRAEGFTNTQPV